METRLLPTASAAHPASRNSFTVFRFTPPVGMISSWGERSLDRLDVSGTQAVGGEYLHEVGPGLVGVEGLRGRVGAGGDGDAVADTRRDDSGTEDGGDDELAPARIARRAVVSSRTEPRPRRIWSPNFAAAFSMTAIALGVVIVNSTASMPPSRSAWVASINWLESSARMMATMPGVAEAAEDLGFFHFKKDKVSAGRGASRRRSGGSRPRHGCRRGSPRGRYASARPRRRRNR